MPEFAPVLKLSSLNGSNGFRLDGVAAFDLSGFSVSSAGDVNGDGFDDVVVGAHFADPNGSLSGSSYVVFGKAGGFASSLNLSTLKGSNGFRLDGVAAGDLSGRSVASAGDVDGDGFDDLIVGAVRADPNGQSGAGSSYVVFGKAGGFASSLNLSVLDGTNGFRLDGAAGELSGCSVASAGDINGDGFDDVIVGAYRADPNGDTSGSSYVVFGKADGFASSLNLSTLNGVNGFRLDGVTADDASGITVASAEDVNGDSFDDVIVGTFSADPNGQIVGSAYVVFGRSAFAATVQLSSLNGSNGFRLDGLRQFDFAGSTVSGAGDVNGDGFTDLLVSSHGFDRAGAYEAGAAYVVFGKVSGYASVIDLGILNGNDGFRIEGVTAGDEAGRSVSAAGDVNGDGFADLIVGAQFADPNGDSSGSSYVVFGHRALTAVNRVGTDLNNRINGGIDDDAILGVSGNDTLIGWEGADTISGGGGRDNVDGGEGADNIDGGSGNDALGGGNGDDSISGSDGNDRLVGWEGNDAVRGSDGSDTVIAGAGEDEIFGGSGRDTFDLATFGNTGVTLNLSSGTFSHPNGEDTQTLVSIENVVGTNGNDVLVGNFKKNILAGSNGNDVLNGAANDDFLNGQNGNDTIHGSAGSDVLQGGLGKDSLNGGTEADRFDFNLVTESLPGATRDTISGFEQGHDVIDLSTIDANVALGNPGNQAFTFIGTAAFTAPGQVRAESSSGNTNVEASNDGDTSPEMAFIITGPFTPTLADFML